MLGFNLSDYLKKLPAPGVQAPFSPSPAALGVPGVMGPAPEIPQASLFARMKEQLARPAVQQGLMGAGASMLQASGWNDRPVTFGQAMGLGAQGWQQGYQGAIDRDLDRKFKEAQIASAYARQRGNLVNMMDPKTKEVRSVEEGTSQALKLAELGWTKTGETKQFDPNDTKLVTLSRGNESRTVEVGSPEAKALMAAGWQKTQDAPNPTISPYQTRTLEQGDERIAQGWAGVDVAERNAATNEQRAATDAAKANQPPNVPATIVTALAENQVQLNTIAKARQSLTNALEKGENPTSFWKGFWNASIDLVMPGNPGSQVLNFFDPEGRATRSLVADIGSMVIKDRSGAAVTAAESPRLQPFIPAVGDPGPVVDMKLAQLEQKIKEENMYIEQAYGGSPQGRGGAVQIQSEAQYLQLPSGSTYIAPDGSTRRKP